MRVGPHSAGAVPGPACYGLGGIEPTVTDANLFLGRLGTSSLLSGEMLLDEARAAKAIETLALEASLELTSFAEGILAISNAAMADAMRTITVSQGVDPREFTLVAFGGAGPMAAAFLADELDIGEVLIPRFPGTFSAWGMLQTDLRHDFTRSFFRPVDSVEKTEIEQSYTTLESEGRESVSKEGIAEKDISYQRSADMRYTGQEYTINVPVLAATDLATTKSNFHAAYQLRYGHSNPVALVEFVNLRVAALGAVKKFAQSNSMSRTNDDIKDLGERNAVFNGVAYKTPILSRDRLAAGFSSNGPVIIEEHSATTVVPPDWLVEVDAQGNILMRRGSQ